MNYSLMSNEAIQQEMGRRLQHERLNLNLTQNTLANRAGIARRTLVAAEAGEGMTLGTFIAILRELGLVDRLDAILSEPAPSPVQLAKLHGATRQRASRQRKPMSSRLAEEPAVWRWKE